MSDCIFCRIVAGEVPADKVFENEHCLAFRDLNPQAPVHVLVIPKQHFANLLHVPDDQSALLGHLLAAATAIAGQLDIAESGFRVVINCNADGGQTVDHLHVHLLGGRVMHWPPG